MEKEKDRRDAGLRSLNHYKNRLPRWRYYLREKFLPVVRWETQYVAWLQEKLRTPALDSYFAISANLGTHTFFMVVLPILFWCGYTSLGRGMVHVLASGVFFSGFVKDMLCLPRPLSPPLQRITMSGSAALEYGFPSTHSTNAISVVVYSLYILAYEEPDISPTAKLVLQIIAYCYGFSIVLGRVYCGMHGFLDVLCGSLLGGAIAVVQCLYGAAFDRFLYEGDPRNVAIIVLVICVLVRIHPEPVDDCPCFDDSVAFAGVMIGVQFGNWHFDRTEYSLLQPCHATVPFDLQKMGWALAVARIATGVLMIFAWRGTMKPTLLRILPPVFRIVEKLGLTLPRRFFKQASEYKRVPTQPHDDNIIPAVSEIPQMLTSLRRRRAVSIGPQSEADAYETMAYREKRRRDSLSDLPSPSPQTPPTIPSADPKLQMSNGVVGKTTRPVALTGVQLNPATVLPPATSPIELSDSQSQILGAPAAAGATSEDDSDLFSNLTKPRVRYDVEVITKLVVYSGIAWLATELCPVFFEVAGLGSR